MGDATHNDQVYMVKAWELLMLGKSDEASRMAVEHRALSRTTMTRARYASTNPRGTGGAARWKQTVKETGAKLAEGNARLRGGVGGAGRGTASCADEKKDLEEWQEDNSGSDEYHEEDPDSDSRSGRRGRTRGRSPESGTTGDNGRQRKRQRTRSEDRTDAGHERSPRSVPHSAPPSFRRRRRRSPGPEEA